MSSSNPLFHVGVYIVSNPTGILRRSSEVAQQQSRVGFSRYFTRKPRNHANNRAETTCRPIPATCWDKEEAAT